MERRDQMPELVYLGLWGLNTRRAASGFMWGCIVVGVACAVASVRFPVVRDGAFILLAALWYGYAIRWVDKNSSWSQES